MDLPKQSNRNGGPCAPSSAAASTGRSAGAIASASCAAAIRSAHARPIRVYACLLYTSDAADDM
eukprot:1544287-Alexandrium_andersonii.AAC.1